MKLISTTSIRPRALALAAALASSVAFSPAHAAPALGIVGGSFGGAGSPLTVGWNFTVLSPVNVTSLGIFDKDLNGLAQSHDVGIWDGGGGLVASATVPGGTGAPLTDQFRYQSISAVSLSPGNYKIGALYADDADLFVYQATGLSVDPSIAFGGNAGLNGSSLARPTSSFGSFYDPGLFGPNFQIGAASVPDGGSALALFALGVLPLLGYRRRLA